MNNLHNTAALDLLRHSRRIVAMLEQNIALEEILMQMTERDELVATMERNGEAVTDPDIVLELIQLRQDEAALLQPHRLELASIKASLIKINQLGQYIANDL